MPLPVFYTSLTAWFEAGMFIEVGGLDLLTKRISVSVMQEDNEHDKYAVNDHL